MSTTETKDPPKDTKKETAPEKVEDSAPAFEKSYVDQITNQFSEDVEVEYIQENRTRLNVKKEKIIDVAKFIKDKNIFDNVSNITDIILYQ